MFYWSNLQSTETRLNIDELRNKWICCIIQAAYGDFIEIWGYFRSRVEALQSCKIDQDGKSTTR